jgi:germination protein M
MRWFLAVPMLAVLVTGCGGKEESATDTDTATASGNAMDVRVYLLRDGKLWPAPREISAAGDRLSEVVGLLVFGPSKREDVDLEFSSAIPSEVAEGQTDISEVEGGVRIEFPVRLPEEALAQVVYTFTQFPEIRSVEIEGRRYTRADFEDLTPAILVESPLPFEEVTSPLRVTGTANTFEANFHYELTDTDGRIVSQNFVTATSGTGTRGTFELTARFTAPFDGIGELIVFERSAETGERIHLVEVPLRMKKTPP